MPRFVLQGLEVALFPVFARERQQSDVAGALDGGGQLTLVLCTCAGLAARTDLTVVRDVTFEKVYLFIIDCQLFVRAKLTELRTRVKAAFLLATKISFFSHLLLRYNPS